MFWKGDTADLFDITEDTRTRKGSNKDSIISSPEVSQDGNGDGQTGEISERGSIATGSSAIWQDDSPARSDPPSDPSGTSEDQPQPSDHDQHATESTKEPVAVWEERGS